MVKVTMPEAIEPVVLELLVQPIIEDVAREVRNEARRRAPALKKWISLDDGIVRPMHVYAHHEHPPVPANLRFALPSAPRDMREHGVGPVTYLDRPRDPTAGIPYQYSEALYNCRCRLATDPFGLSRQVKTGAAVVDRRGRRVTVTVSVEAPFAHEAELGDLYPGAARPAIGSFFMSAAAKTIALRRSMAR